VLGLMDALRRPRTSPFSTETVPQAKGQVGQATVLMRAPVVAFIRVSEFPPELTTQSRGPATTTA
jgi:hypothetical protein